MYRALYFNTLDLAFLSNFVILVSICIAERFNDDKICVYIRNLKLNKKIFEKRK